MVEGGPSTDRGGDAATTIGTLRHLDKIERISVKTTTKEEFIERFERTRTPCVITDAMEDWPCYGKREDDGGASTGCTRGSAMSSLKSVRTTMDTR